MRIWLGLLAAPSVALACQAILFALATPACSSQSRVELHAVAAASLALTLAFTVIARGGWASHGGGMTQAEVDHADGGTVRAFLAAAATAVAAISAFTVLAMWAVVGVLSPCAQ
ncbi:hypothetical protein [Caenimonas aquaedulcis]|uniref:Uncharacterized protein n=1 Tax=Caenimonas aquaedulcis TaxID=2793270 RepID=A0A931MFT4_9BURK|nr:hypothetical protein [Caenimonas aquaedulcis]MBG9387616.1 hypothetical protein [Caenimonas aquaedulcis]